MRTLATALRPAVLTLLASALAAPVIAGDGLDQAPALDTLESGQYTLTVSGPANAHGERLSIGEGDIQIDDSAILAGDEIERAIYTQDPIAKSDNENGPYQVKMVLAGDYVRAEGVKNPAVAISLHLNGNLAPDTYPIEEAYFDVGPGAVPVAVMAMLVSADRGMRAMFDRDVSGTLQLEKLDREGATGRFFFRISAANQAQPLRVSGAFKDVPWSPGEH